MTKILLNKRKSVKIHKGIYTIFYLILALFFVICIIELRNNVIIRNNYKKPYPRLEVQPRINESPNVVLIRYDENDVTTVDRWIKIIDNYLEAYRTKTATLNVEARCDFQHPPKKGQNCPIDLDDFGPCSSPFYGYYSFSPCIFLSLSEIYDWIPEYYNSTEGLPPSMPKDLVEEINATSTQHASNQIWVSCEGETELDRESIDGINYYPRRGFPSYYFPTVHRNAFVSPLIAVEINNPFAGYIISIKCRIWSKDLPYKNSELDRGSVTFGIMRDELTYPDY